MVSALHKPPSVWQVEAVCVYESVCAFGAGGWVAVSFGNAWNYTGDIVGLTQVCVLGL